MTVSVTSPHSVAHGRAPVVSALAPCEPPAFDTDSPGVSGCVGNARDQDVVRFDEPTPVGVDAALRALSVAAMKRVLEVLDRRRPVQQLSALAIPQVLDQLRVLTGTRAMSSLPAVLARVHLQRSGAEAVEVFASYRRGERTHAIAARLEMVDAFERLTANGPRRRIRRWTLVALAVG